ncbi:MAG: acetyl-CoA C-acyltransferase, partial [Bdellovibrionaceae bacterium]|nr:acetyl-CoA C-acyltransferase [Pseudobdellovibrionaceae bacterium]
MSFPIKVAILGGVRTPFVKSQTNYLGQSNQDMLGATVNELVKRKKLQGKLLGDVIAGAVMNHPFDWNLSREVVLGSELNHNTPGMNIQRACGTGLEAANIIALKITTGQIEAGLGGGTDTNSDMPLILPKPFTHWLIRFQNAKGIKAKISQLLKFEFKFLKPQIPGVMELRTGKSMGDHTELMVKEWKISRQDQDILALRSHQNAAKAYDEGFHDDLIMEFQGLKRDTITRKETTLEKLLKLKPAFDKSPTGTLTAGNSTPLTDGASIVLLGSEEWAQKNNQEVMAYFKDCEVAAV